MFFGVIDSVEFQNDHLKVIWRPEFRLPDPYTDFFTHLTSVFFTEASVADTHLLAGRVNIVNCLAANESLFFVNMVCISQTVTTIVTVESETGARSASALAKLVTK